MSRRSILTFLCLAFGVAFASIAEDTRIIVGPNILVSRDGDMPHVELIAACDPRNPKNIVGAAITSSSVKGGWATKTYASVDGGITWNHTSFPELHERGGLDPQVGYGLQGTAYFASLAYVKDEKGQDRAGLLFYRSEDNGRTWSEPFDMGFSYDHPIMGVDQTKGAYAGRIYLSVLYGYPVYTVGIFRSEDDGRTFVGPVEAANGGGKIGINTISSVVILRDGTLLVPYVDFEFDPEKSKKQNALNFWMVSSKDGGITFSKPQKIGVQRVTMDRDALRFFGVATAAADLSTAHPDRVYLVWNDFTANGKFRMMISYSADRGRTWSKAAPIDSSAPAHAHQFQPAIAVNKDGVVGITWFDTRNSQDGSRYDEYFAASVDGGKTFLPSVRISSESSIPAGGANEALIPDVYVMQGKMMMGFMSAYSRWSNGGDYMGLSADTDGTFHPFWADSRTGTFQIQTATVKVVKDKNKTNGPDKSAKVETDLTNKVQILFDPAKYDASSKTIDIPIHIKNTSGETIYGPIKLELVSFGGGFEWEDAEDIKKNAPEILNASNGQKGAGAAFDFTAALGSEPELLNGALTGAVVWKMKLVDPNNVPQLLLKVTGSVLKK